MSLLYLDHFGLSKPPFQITPDPDFFFSGGRRGDILSALLHVARHEEGIITLVAEVGSGKTLLARLMIAQLGEGVCSVYLANPCFSREEIIGAIGRDLGLSPLSGSLEEKLAALRQELLRRHALGQRVVLVVDEAHAMPADSLEEVRLLSNLETAQHKLINIMLFGQPELDAVLADPRLRQMRDRVVHRFELMPLPQDEAAAYVDHRLRAAGWHGGRLFAPAAQALLIKASGGRARRINLLADKALLAAYSQGQSSVQIEHVRNAVQELQADPAPAAVASWRVPGWALGLLGLVAGVALTLAVMVFWGGARQPPAVPVSPSPVNPASATPAAVAIVPAPVPAPLLTASAARPYTIQLATLPSRGDADHYVGQLKRYGSQMAAAVEQNPAMGKNQVAVYLGRFETEQQAHEAITRLPAALQANRPMVRALDHAQQEPKP